MVSAQREKLGGERAALNQSRDVIRERWRDRVAYLLQSYNRQYLNVKQTRAVNAGQVIDSFIISFESSKRQYEAQIAVIERQIEDVTLRINALVARGL